MQEVGCNAKNRSLLSEGRPAGLHGRLKVIFVPPVIRFHVYDAKPSACRKFLLAGGGWHEHYPIPKAYPEFIFNVITTSQIGKTQGQSVSLTPDALVYWILALADWKPLWERRIEYFLQRDESAAPLTTSLVDAFAWVGLWYSICAHKNDRIGHSHRVTVLITMLDDVVVQSGCDAVGDGRPASWPKLGSDGAGCLLYKDLMVFWGSRATTKALMLAFTASWRARIAKRKFGLGSSTWKTSRFFST